MTINLKKSHVGIFQYLEWLIVSGLAKTVLSLYIDV